LNKLKEDIDADCNVLKSFEALLNILNDKINADCKNIQFFETISPLMMNLNDGIDIENTKEKPTQTERG